MTDNTYPCLNCDRVIPGPHTFCPFCGGNQMELEVTFASADLELKETRMGYSGEESAKATGNKKPVSSPRKSQKKGPLFKLFGALTAIFIALIAVAGNSPVEPSTSSSNQSSSQNVSADSTDASPTPSVIRASFADIKNSGPATVLAEEACEGIEGGIDNPDFLPISAEQASSQVGNIRSKDAAKEYTTKHKKWINKDMVKEFRIWLRGKTDSLLEDLIFASGYEIGYEIDKAEWSADFMNHAVEICRLGELKKDVESQIQEFQKSVDKVLELAS